MREGDDAMRLRSVAFGLTLAAGAAGAQIVECVDAKGNREYAQFCGPATVRGTPVSRNLPPPSGADAPSAAQAIAEQEAAARKRELERREADAKTEKERADAENAQKNCDAAQGHLRSLQEGHRVVRTDRTTGERSVVDDDTRPAEIAAAQKIADAWCKR
jgi:hypothetical protein